MLQKAVDEFFCGEGAELGLSGVGSAIAKGDLIMFQLGQAALDMAVTVAASSAACGGWAQLVLNDSHTTA